MNDMREAPSPDNADEFDPRDAAALLDRATLQARRHFEPSPPWVLAVRAALALVVYGSL